MLNANKFIWLRIFACSLSDCAVKSASTIVSLSVTSVFGGIRSNC